MATKLFVGNLSFNTTEGDILDLFKQAGNVTSCELIMDKFTGKSRGFAFVQMGTQEEANKAVIVVNNAGILRDRMIFNMSEEDFDAVVAVHLEGTFNSPAMPPPTGVSSTRPAMCSTAALSTPVPTPACWAMRAKATTARPRPPLRPSPSSSIAK